MKLLTLLALLGACQRGSNETACEELAKYASEGVVLASDEKRCGEILDFAATVPERYGMDFATWLKVVPAQGVTFLFDAIYALTERTTWDPQSFALEPQNIACGGSAVSEEEWGRSTLSKIVTKRPEKIYAALSIDIPTSPGDIATIKIVQDFNCDQNLGTMQVIGQFRRGISPFTGGWSRISTLEPELDE
ncbi:MAG: hypothetical protein H0T89_16420 [Deltaproteobacteria bacterium]|nr:hypothetical protein [Deltaproteobacteria bacterium]MDQ3297605.1 hypothetical protein [Myxococcota bacterium]